MFFVFSGVLGTAMAIQLQYRWLKEEPAGPLASKMDASMCTLSLVLVTLIIQNAAWPQDPAPRLHIKYRKFNFPYGKQRFWVIGTYYHFHQENWLRLSKVLFLFLPLFMITMQTISFDQKKYLDALLVFWIFANF